MDIEPAVLTTKQAWVYCGGRPNFEALLAQFPELLKPWRRTANQHKTYYLREVIDRSLKAAQLSQSLVAP